MSAGRVSTRLDERAGGRVAWLIIERAEKLNALDPATIAALTAAARSLNDDEALRAVVVTGAGDRAFIGGADIATMAALDADGGEAFITALHHAIAALRAIPVPVIARVNGYCLGAGLEVAAACDLRVASARAMFGMPEVKVGMPSVIEAALLPRLIGMGRAAELVLLGENIDAARALAIGLVEKVVPPDELDAAVEAWIAAILANGPQAVRLQKALMREWERLPLDEAIAAGIATYRTSVAGGEPARMLAEFMARRKK
ncbi:MAG TPA: enoyl-CoA hydratase [Xanthobacteraceae bacterium]|jgi:enoyl-CoA hydratase/carnithine racemase|nr:enoyl-CoA hydratase [Xanthobacteraceae bacterium]